MVGEIGFRKEHRIDLMATVDGFADYRDFPNITRGLVSRGYSDEEIQGILGATSCGSSKLCVVDAHFSGA